MLTAPQNTQQDAVSFKLSQCGLCRHYRFDATCEAYPQGIPAEILADQVSHKRPQPGDRGIRFQPAPASTTTGPVRYARIWETTRDGWDVVGAIWLGDDGACGFMPRAKYEGTPDGTSRAWIARVRDAWRLGRTVRQVWDYWSTYDNGVTIRAGRVGRADNLEWLRARLGRDD